MRRVWFSLMPASSLPVVSTCKDICKSIQLLISSLKYVRQDDLEFIFVFDSLVLYVLQYLKLTMEVNFQLTCIDNSL